MSLARLSRRAVSLGAAAVVLAAPLGAQAWSYPSFQIPEVVSREYNFGVAQNAGTTGVVQWREGISPLTQLSLDGGITNPDGSGSVKVFAAGNYARRLTVATTEQPLDLLFTAGLGVALGDGPALVRVPVGVSVGHRFPLEGGLAITHYVHPRLSLDVLSRRPVAGGNRSELNLNFDLGGSFEVSRELALRASVMFGGGRTSDSAGFGLSLAYTPPALH